MPRRGNLPSSRMDAKRKARLAITAFLRSVDESGAQIGQMGLQPKWHQPRPDEWTISLVGSSQQTINVELSLGEYTLQMVAFFMRRPDENVADVYGQLLQRNTQVSLVKFAADEFGDLFLRAELPVACVSPDLLDGTIGVLYSCADSSYMPVMRLGFASAFDR